MKTLTQKTLSRLVKNSSNTVLFTNVIEQGCFNSDDVINIMSCGINGGFSGFIYYAETNQFYDVNKNDILKLAYEMIDDCVYNGIGQLLASFRCLKGYTPFECEIALFQDNDDTMVVKNALTWFAAEECCRYIYDILENNGRV